MAAKGAIESASAASLEFWPRLASEFWRDVKGLVAAGVKVVRN